MSTFALAKVSAKMNRKYSSEQRSKEIQKPSGFCTKFYTSREEIHDRRPFARDISLRNEPTTPLLTITHQVNGAAVAGERYDEEILLEH